MYENICPRPWNIENKGHKWIDGTNFVDIVDKNGLKVLSEEIPVAVAEIIVNSVNNLEQFKTVLDKIKKSQIILLMFLNEIEKRHIQTTFIKLTH